MKKNATKILLLSSIALFWANISITHAQVANAAAGDGNNLVKWNVAALLLKNYSFQYERAIGPKMSLAAGIRFAPKSNVPFKTKLENAIDDEDTWNSIKDFKTGNFAITPELRFYLGKEVFRGFYIAPFLRYATYTASVPLKFDVEFAYEDVIGTVEQTIDLDGNVTALTAGVLFGAQWKLSKQVYLDWWILGPNYGTSTGDIAGKRPLSQEEQDGVREALDGFDDLPLVHTKYTVDSNGAKVDFDGPWAGVRSGLSVGFRF